MEQAGALLGGLAALAWPVIVAIILFSFRDIIKAILDTARSRKFTIKVAGNELSMEEASEQQRLLISDLQKQIVDIQEKLATVTSGSIPAAPTPTPKKASSLQSILWVDDVPRNNATVIDSLTKLGITVTTALSTAEALAKFERTKFDRIVSDMGRNEDGTYNRTAGMDLIRQIRAIDTSTPIIIYSSARAAQQYRTQAIDLGATAVTSSPTELIRLLELPATPLNP